MYSGTTLNKRSGNMLGVHQRINRQARRKLQPQLGSHYFPSITSILHFEGIHGPDGIKRKNPSKDEPWHFVDPTDPNDKALLKLMHNHQINLASALKTKDNERAAFEAAWLAHAVVDGLTPAHHYPLEEKLETVLGKSIKTRTSVRKKVLFPGNSARQRIRNNWEFWGAKGVLTSHYLFEFGVASATLPISKMNTTIEPGDIQTLQKEGFEALFTRSLRDIHQLGMYEKFVQSGWTAQLARQTRQQLLPTIIKTVVMAWLDAVYASQR